MRKTLFLKFLLAYILFGFFGFLAVAIISSHTFINSSSGSCSAFNKMFLCAKALLYFIKESRYSLSYCEMTTSIKRRRSSLPPAISSESEGETEPEATTSTAPLTWRYAYMLDTPPENRPYDSSITYDEDVLNTYVKLPLVYEEEFEGIIYKIEFYEEIVPMHSYILSRITITNTTDAEFCYRGGTATPGIFKKENDDTLEMSKNSWMNRFCDIAWIEQIYPGESFVHQSVHFVSSEFFQYGNEYIYKNSFREEHSKNKYFISFPIEVLKHE